MAGAIAEYVDAFVDGVSAELGELAGADHTRDVVVEAGDLVAAVIDSDERRSTAELEAWLDDIGTRLEPPVLVSSERLRDSETLTGKRAWLSRPSTLFDLLLRADARDGTAGRCATTSWAPASPMPRRRSTSCRHPPRSPPSTAGGSCCWVRSTPTASRVRDARRRRARAGEPAKPSPQEPELAPERPIEELLAELDALVGLEQVKADVRRLTSLLRIQRLRAERGMPTIETSHHLVFTGNPGTGKTTVARLLSQILRTLGIVSKGHLVETDRSHLVAGYVGQTAERTRKVLESALGGTLLIDEAYALARGSEQDFGREAIDTLVKFMEDHRDDLAVIAAGYPEEMAELIDANPGLSSRFARTIHFPDYTTEELLAIFESMSGAKRYDLDEQAALRLAELIDAEPRTRGFGNARFVRNLFEAAIARQAERLAIVEHPTDDQLTTLTAADVGAPPPAPPSPATGG